MAPVAGGIARSSSNRARTIQAGYDAAQPDLSAQGNVENDPAGCNASPAVRQPINVPGEPGRRHRVAEQQKQVLHAGACLCLDRVRGAVPPGVRRPELVKRAQRSELASTDTRAGLIERPLIARMGGGDGVSNVNVESSPRVASHREITHAHTGQEQLPLDERALHRRRC